MVLHVFCQSKQLISIIFPQRTGDGSVAKKSTFFQTSENFHQPNRLTRNPLNPKDILRCSGGTALKICLKPMIFYQINLSTISIPGTTDSPPKTAPMDWNTKNHLKFFSHFSGVRHFFLISFSSDTDFAVFPADVAVGRVWAETVGERELFLLLVFGEDREIRAGDRTTRLAGRVEDLAPEIRFSDLICKIYSAYSRLHTGYIGMASHLQSWRQDV